MAVKTFEKCMDKILEDLEFRRTVDYASKTAVRKYNAAYGKIRKNILYIEKNYPEKRNVFIEMLAHEDPYIACAFGCFILNHLSCTLEQKWYALSVIKKLYNTGKLARTEFSNIWITIKHWEKILQAEEEKRSDNDSLS